MPSQSASIKAFVCHLSLCGVSICQTADIGTIYGKCQLVVNWPEYCDSGFSSLV